MSITNVETTPLEHLEYCPLIPCEGQDHKRGILGHKVDEPGAFYLITPCCGRATTVQCKPRIDYMIARGTLSCTACKHEYRIEDFRIIPV